MFDGDEPLPIFVAACDNFYQSGKLSGSWSGCRVVGRRVSCRVLSGTPDQPLQPFSGTFPASRPGTRQPSQTWAYPHPSHRFRQVPYQLEDLNIDGCF